VAQGQRLPAGRSVVRGQKTILLAQFKASKGVNARGRAQDAIQAMLDADEDEPTPTTRRRATKGATAIAAAARHARRRRREDPVVELKAQLDGMRREQTVYRLCGDKHPEIAEKAIKAGWSDDVIKIAVESAELRATMPKIGADPHRRRQRRARATTSVLEAASRSRADFRKWRRCTTSRR
jgi:hypothetical protein